MPCANLSHTSHHKFLKLVTRSRSKSRLLEWRCRGRRYRDAWRAVFFGEVAKAMQMADLLVALGKLCQRFWRRERDAGPRWQIPVRVWSAVLVRTFWPRPGIWVLFRGTGSGDWLLTAVPGMHGRCCLAGEAPSRSVLRSSHSLAHDTMHLSLGQELCCILLRKTCTALHIEQWRTSPILTDTLQFAKLN